MKKFTREELLVLRTIIAAAGIVKLSKDLQTARIHQQKHCQRCLGKDLLQILFDLYGLTGQGTGRQHLPS